MSVMNLPPVINPQYLDNNGLPLAGGSIYTYQAGTTTPQATYTDQSGGTPNANPIVLDSAGRCSMWLDPTLSYKFVFKDSGGNTIKTVDNVVGLLSANAVNTASIADGAVTTAKLANNSVTSAILASDASVDGNRAVQTNHIRDAQITRAKMALGGLSNAVVSAKTTTYSITSSDDVITCDASGGAFTVTLPTASGVAGRSYLIKKTDSSFNAVTIATTSSQTIEGSTTTKLSTQYESIEVMSDGSNWLVTARRIPSNWKNYSLTIGGSTTAPTLGTTSVNDAEWRRVGDSIEIHVDINQTSVGTVGSGTYLFPLPAGLTADTANKIKGTLNTSGQCAVGGGTIVGGGTPGQIDIQLYDSGNMYALVNEMSQTASSATFSLANNPWKISFTALIPISGWSG